MDSDRVVLSTGVRHTHGSDGVPALDFFEKGVSVRKTVSVCQCRQTIFTNDAIDLVLRHFLGVWVEEHCNEEPL